MHNTLIFVTLRVSSALFFVSFITKEQGKGNRERVRKNFHAFVYHPPSLITLSMYISWHGLSCLRVQTKETTLLIDPFSAKTGLTSPRLQADLILFSESDNPQREAAQKTASFVLAGPGEYEVHGVSVTGTGVEEQRDGKPHLLTLYTLTAEGVLVGFLGPLGRTLEAQELEHLQDVDVLFVPVGGNGVMTAKQAMETVSEIEPRMVVPYYYRIPRLTVKLDGVEAFLKEAGEKHANPETKLRITKKDLPEEEDMRIVTLQP